MVRPNNSEAHKCQVVGWIAACILYRLEMR